MSEQVELNKSCPSCQGGIKGGLSIHNDQIPESMLARWAYRVSYVPIIGVPFFMLFGFISLLRISIKGMTGLRLLWKGIQAGFIVNLILFAPYLLGYCCELAVKIPYLPAHGSLVTHQYENGQKRAETWYLFGKKYKLYMWHENGKKHFECSFKSDKVNGKFTGWHKNGQKHYESFANNSDIVIYDLYKDPIIRKTIGLWTSWYDNGHKAIERYLGKNSFTDRKRTSWDRNGIKYCDESFNEDGKLIKKINYVNGKPVEIDLESCTPMSLAYHYNNGEIVYSSTFLDVDYDFHLRYLINGHDRIFVEDVKLEKIEHFRNEVKFFEQIVNDKMEIIKTIEYKDGKPMTKDTKPSE